MIHYAQLKTSPRLQRLLKFLSDGKPHTTREIVMGAEIMAVSTAVDELRENGFLIECRPVGRGRYEYRLVSNEQRAMSNEEGQGEIASASPRNDKREAPRNDIGDEDKSKAIIESIMERNFQLSLKV